MMALNITADKIALSALFKYMTFNDCNPGIDTMNKAGTMAKYLATSLAMLKVVSVPRVMSNCC